MNVIGQSNSQQAKNNCFNDITRDSILSKLYDRKYIRMRNTNLVMTLRKSDSTIIDYAYKSKLQADTERKYIEALKKKDSINNSTEKILQIEKKKKVKNALIFGGSGIVIGIIIKSFF